VLLHDREPSRPGSTTTRRRWPWSLTAYYKPGYLMSKSVRSTRRGFSSNAELYSA